MPGTWFVTMLKINHTFMLSNDLKPAIRHLIKRKFFSLINIIGLAIGVTACILISFYVRYHNSYDKLTPDNQQVYRILYERWNESGDHVKFASASPTIGPALKANFPEILTYARAYKLEGIFFNDDIFFEENRAFYGETALLDLLGFKIVMGDPANCLDEPNKVILSASNAKKYFGEEDPIGKILRHNNQRSFEVSAVFEDRPDNTHFKTDLMVSLGTWISEAPELFSQGWFYSGFFTYAKVEKGADIHQINLKIQDYIDQEFGETLAYYKMNMGFELQALTDIHLSSHFMHELEPNGDRTAINLLEITAWFILVIAWINFFNLSSITSIHRLREIGIRKVNGATKKQVIFQFLAESALLNFTAIIIAIVIIEAILPWFSDLAGLPDTFSLWSQYWYYFLLAIAFFIGTFSSGIYSASGIESSNLVMLLKGCTNNQQKGSVAMRKTLVTLQFAIALALMTATIAIYQQYLHISKINPGFRNQDMIVCKAPSVGDSTLTTRFRAFTDAMQTSTDVEGACFSSVIPGKSNMFNRGGIYRYGDQANNGKNYRVTETDANYFEVYKIPFLAGRGLSSIPSVDKNLVVINSFASMHLGFDSPEEAVGQKIVMENTEYQVSGVVIDFFQLSPKEAIEPQIFRYHQRFQGYFTVAADTQDPSSLISFIEDAYSKIFPNNPFQYFFLDDYYNQQFQYEKRFGMVFGMFSVLSVILTVMGLLGLAAYTAEQRKKEIGIRKVMGASFGSITTLLLREYIVLWLIAALVALPVVIFLIQSWLQGFASRITMGWTVIVIPLSSILLITIITVIVQSYRAISLNPLNCIQYE
jgi:putative ABC transport system permease protein